MYEFAIKRGGLTFNRILFNQTTTLRNAFATLPMAQRLKIEFKVRKFENGKEVDRKYVKKPFEALTLNVIGKAVAK